MLRKFNRKWIKRSHYFCNKNEVQQNEWSRFWKIWKNSYFSYYPTHTSEFLYKPLHYIIKPNQDAYKCSRDKTDFVPNWNNCQKLNRAGNYLPKVNNRNTRKRCEACSKLTIKTLERHHWRRSGVFIVNFEHISHLALVSLLLTLNI